MKLILSAFFGILLLTANDPVVDWLTPTNHDFGDLPNSEEVYTQFRVRNTTDKPIFIDAVRPGCGCTIPDWSEEAIPPDSIAVLDVWYKPKSKGYFREKIKVYFSAQRRAELLFIEGYVVEE
jgi:hypothetical protein